MKQLLLFIFTFGYIGFTSASPLVFSQKDINETARFGKAVSRDASVVAIGAPGDNKHGFDSGAVYIYEKTGSNWQHTTTLYHDAPEADMEFGFAVAVSGARVAVGCPYGGDKAGIFIYSKEDDNWTLEKKLSSTAAKFEGYAQNIDLKGNNLIAGCWANDQNGDDCGLAYFYQYESNDWTLKQTIACPNGDGMEYFGHSVSLSSSKIAISALHQREVHIFSFDGTLVKTVTHDVQWFEAGNFGDCIAISEDYLAVGAPLSERKVGAWDRYSNNGAVYIFSTSDWSQTQKIRPAETTQDLAFGSHDLAINNSHLVVGTSRLTSDLGVYHYKLNGQTWDFHEKITMTPGTTGSSSIYSNSFGLCIYNDEIAIGDTYAYNTIDINIGKVFFYGEGTLTGLVPNTRTNNNSISFNSRTQALLIRSNHPITGYEIINISGKTVFSKKVQSTEIQEQLPVVAKGIYIIKCQNSKGAFSKKILIQ